MPIESDLIPSSVSIDEVTIQENVNGQIYVSETSLKNEVGFASYLNTRRVTATSGDTLRDLSNSYFDILSDATKLGTMTNTIRYVETSESYVGLLFDMDSPNVVCDMTGGSVDARFTLQDDGGNVTCAFDSANDEVDMSTGTADNTQTARVIYNTGALTNAGMIAKIRNFSCNMDYGGLTMFGRLRFGSEAYIEVSQTNTTLTIRNSNGDNVVWGGGGTLSLKIERYGKITRTYYDTAGGSSWTQLGSDYTAGSSTSQNGEFVVGTTNNGGARTLSLSVSVFNIGTDVVSSGSFLTGTATISSSAYTGEVDFVDVDHSVDSSLKCEISHDNGSNYTTIFDGALLRSGTGTVGTAGTTLKKRYTLTRSTLKVSPKVYGHVNRWF